MLDGSEPSLRIQLVVIWQTRFSGAVENIVAFTTFRAMFKTI